MTRPPGFLPLLHSTSKNRCYALLTDTKRETIREIHRSSGHMGVQRTNELVSKLMPTVSSDNVGEAIRDCETCVRIDPANHVKNHHGTLATSAVWKRLAADITYFRGSA